jgi:RNA polymerase sigma-70 factor (ECF subfamily)
MMAVTLTSHGGTRRVHHQQKRASALAVTPVTPGGVTRSYNVDRECELELVARVRDGDIAAFDAVYVMFNTRLFGFLARLTRRRDVAEDLLEETWLRFVAHAGRLDADTRLGPWLFTVARNLHVSYCRSRALDDRCTADAIGLWPSALLNSPFDEAVGNELQRRIETALASLPVPFREVLLLVGVEGLRPFEAALVCGVSAEALRQRLKRARTMLAERLEESEDRIYETRR